MPLPITTPPSKGRSLISALSVPLVAMACSTPALRNEQLEQVAKDWALVIRASQVIPVYPLTEDVQPGDILLVNTPVEDQAKLYKDKGFLPLDQLLHRINSNEFSAFYNRRYGIADGVIPPEHWQKKGQNEPHSWEAAPHASFPSYQFSVKTGSGLNLAIPIQGVPFALGLMQSGSASGTVTIRDAYTFGLDNARLQSAVGEWADSNRLLLRNYGPVDGKYSFLRIVSRVYVTGGVTVALYNDEARGGELGAGADKPVEIMGIQQGQTAENYTATIAAINKLAQDQLPGGKVKIATASSRGVTMDETFDRPLVIGYVGFDMPILPGGRLGPPISTLEQLNLRAKVRTSDVGSVYRLAALSHVHATLKEMSRMQDARAANLLKQLDTLATALPADYPTGFYESTEQGPARIQDASYQRATMQDVLDFQGLAQTTIESLEAYVASGHELDAAQRAALAAARSSLKRVALKVSTSPAAMEAIDHVFFDHQED